MMLRCNYERDTLPGENEILSGDKTISICNRCARGVEITNESTGFLLTLRGSVDLYAWP